LPAFGLPTTATVAAAFRFTAIRSSGTAVSAGAAIRHHPKSARLLVAQRDRGAVDPDLERVAAERPAQEQDLGPFDETEHHQALNGGIGGLDRFDPGTITGLEIRKCQTSAPRQARK
jgi:hypothetical protein